MQIQRWLKYPSILDFKQINAWIVYNLKATWSNITVNERELFEHIAWWGAH